MKEPEIHYSSSIDLHLKRLIFVGLDDYAIEKTGRTSEMEQFTLSILEDDRPVAGLIGVTFWDTLQVDQLYVNDEQRGKGLGSALMRRAEEIAKERNYKMITVETMDFQAVDFYKKLGFQIDFIREGYTNGYKSYFFSKSISQE